MQSQTKQPFKIDSQSQNEISKYFHPKAQVVDILPNPKQSSDLAEILLDNKDGTFTKYQMVKGSWLKGNTLS